MEILRRPTNNKIYGFNMSKDEYLRLRDNNDGLCIYCGAENSGCEPDARKYECESCETKSVYGVENLLMAGGIRIGNERMSI